MIFRPKKRASEKMTPSEKQRVDRLKRQIKASTQNTLNYRLLYENGLMQVTDSLYSRTYRLGDVSYATATHEKRLDIIDTYAAGLNSFDAGTNFQLLIINRRIKDETLNNILYPTTGDQFDGYREEFNDIITNRFSESSQNFEIHKYITIAQEAMDREQAQIQLTDAGTTLANEFKSADIALTDMSGLDRLQVFSELLRDQPYLTFTYRDIALSGLDTKSFVAPGRIKFFEDKMAIDDRLAKVMYIRHYPTFMTDKLVRTLTTLGIELAITVQARPYDSAHALQRINTAHALINKEKLKNQRLAANQGVDGRLMTSQSTNDVGQATELWREEITEHDQKIFSGVIAIYFKADNDEDLRHYAQKIKMALRKLQVDLDEVYHYQEEALNTILPIGETFLNVKRDFMRDMTTGNLVTQVPFSNVDLHSASPTARYYGQNQLSGNIITLDRKKDLNTPSGVILGGSGSGKSMTAKGGEIIPTLLKYPDDRVLIVDPEDEYSDIGREFGAEIIDVSIGSATHINLLDLPDRDKLDSLDKDPEGNKANLLVSLFDGLLEEVSDGAFSVIDRVTRLTYERYDSPTLKEWYAVLKEQPEELAQKLALDLEVYMVGSYSLFSHQTNVNLNNRFVIFNLKKLTGKLKHFALMVIQDYIWNQVVNTKEAGITTWLYFDEIQLYFENEEQATFFNHMYSRIRKYGAIPTGITQNPETLTASAQGRKMLGNSQFKVILKLEDLDLAALKRIVKLTDEQLRYIEKPKDKGTGLIIAGNTIVPFENPIPRDTKLYQLIATDA